MSTVRETLAKLQQDGLDRLDAQTLVLLALQRGPHDRAWLLAHDADALEASALMRLDELVQRRHRGEPMAYLRGEQEFFGLQLAVDSRVLVPRPDTETLVNWALDVLDAGSKSASVLDLGTGSGAIALALKKTRPALDVSAVEASAGALTVARGNAHRLALKLQFIEGSWLDNVSGHFHLIASNPPYVADGDIHLVALSHEPQSALTAGRDGLDDIRTIIAQVPKHLHPQGWLLLEHGYDQAGAVRDLLVKQGFGQVQSRADLAGIARCSGGCWPG